MNKYICIIISILLLGSTSCSKEERMPSAPIVGLGGTPHAITELDRYIHARFIAPYNIDVVYRWDPNEASLVRSMTPVDENKLMDILDIIEIGWLNPYLDVAGAEFLRKYSFSRFFIGGSGDYTTKDTKTVGVATGGVKIALYGINDLDMRDENNFSFYLYILHHEFAHILHQTKFFPSEWLNIPGNNQWFTSNWVQTSNSAAQGQGFVRNYAKMSAEEDFVETISFLLVNGQDAYDKLKLDNPAYADIYKKKEDIVTKFYKDAVGIDFKVLQSKVHASVQTLLSLNK